MVNIIYVLYICFTVFSVDLMSYICVVLNISVQICQSLIYKYNIVVAFVQHWNSCPNIREKCTLDNENEKILFLK